MIKFNIIINYFVSIICLVSYIYLCSYYHISPSYRHTILLALVITVLIYIFNVNPSENFEEKIENIINNDNNDNNGNGNDENDVLKGTYYASDVNDPNAKVINADISKETIDNMLNDIQSQIQEIKVIDAQIDNYKQQLTNIDKSSDAFKTLSNKISELSKKSIELKETITNKTSEYDNIYSVYEANKLVKDFSDERDTIDRDMTEKIIASKEKKQELISKSNSFKDVPIKFPKKYTRACGCHKRQATFDEQYLESLNHSINRYLQNKDCLDKSYLDHVKAVDEAKDELYDHSF